MPVRIHAAPPAWRRPLLFGLVALTVTVATIAAIPWRCAAAPEDDALVGGEHLAAPAYDLWGRPVGAAEASAWTEPPAGAVAIDDAMLRRGRAAFYTEDFGNDLVVTDLLGLMSGPLRPWQVLRAALAASAEGTTNLRVALADDLELGDLRLARGDLIDTGLDVARGAWLPLGVVVRLHGLRLRVGVACALCHSAVDPDSGRVIHGAANGDLRAGLLLALATNSAAYFTRTNVHDPLAVAPGGPAIHDSLGRPAALPERAALEDAVDRVLVAWPPGSFDATADLVANPTRIPGAFTFACAPFGWSGAGIAGPFRGLAAFTNNLHGFSTDALAQAHLSAPRFGLDPELYLGIVLQGAARSGLRFQPGRDPSPSARLALADPTPGAPGLAPAALAPTFPRASPVAADGLFATAADDRFWQHALAIAAWQDTLAPPEVAVDREAAARGRDVFARAGCPTCHSGPAYTNQRVVPVALVGTEPSRARALARTRDQWTDEALLFPFDAPVPLPPAVRTIVAPLDEDARAQLRLAMAHDGVGGYKVPGLLGLWWSAPYLHDGGVAVGVDEALVGVGDTRGRGLPVDPRSSLRALVDRELRGRVLAANRADARRWELHVRGVGHEFWVDPPAGFSAAEQRALIEHLLSLRPAP